MNSIEQLLAAAKHNPETVGFADVMAVIDQAYHYTPCAFRNGTVTSEAGQNEGSCKILAFAKLHQLGEPETLTLFGDYYRQDVLAHPDGNDHANIRQFMKTGWNGVSFDSSVLQPKTTA
ncbi:MAG: HopJ type III effector protein [Burkholderiaceae bacterium]